MTVSFTPASRELDTIFYISPYLPFYLPLYCKTFQSLKRDKYVITHWLHKSVPYAYTTPPTLCFKRDLDGAGESGVLST